MSTADLDEYLLTNWSDVDAAVVRANALDQAVIEAIAEETLRWADMRGWAGVYGYESIWLSSPAWTRKHGSRPSADAWFSLDYFGADDEAYGLTSLIGAGRGQAGFVFRQERMGARAWRAKATSTELLDLLPGFELQPPAEIFLPIRLDRAEVIEGARAGDYSSAVRPVLDILARLETAAEVIDGHLDPRL